MLIMIGISFVEKMTMVFLVEIFLAIPPSKSCFSDVCRLEKGVWEVELEFNIPEGLALGFLHFRLILLSW